MNIIAMGYSGTGSSAITQLISEYEKATDGGLGTFEHVLLYMPHGLFDLGELLLSNNSLYRSDAAIREFKEAMSNLNENDYGWFGGYKNRYGEVFQDIVKDFTNQIIQFTRPGNWYNDYQMEKSGRAFITDFAKSLIGIKTPNYGKSIRFDSDGVVYYSFVNEFEFERAAKEFTRRYMNMVRPPAYDTMVYDQLVLPNNLHFASRYFDDDTKFIVVDRDPRDMFVLSKYVWSRDSGYSIFPCNVEEFVDFYLRYRSSEVANESSCVLRLHFEDLVYRYNESVESIEEFIGADHLGRHEGRLNRFNPEVSLSNTQNFRIDKRWEVEVKYIEKHMGDYLYEYPYSFVPNLKDTSDPQ